MVDESRSFNEVYSEFIKYGLLAENIEIAKKFLICSHCIVSDEKEDLFMIIPYKWALKALASGFKFHCKY